MTEPNRPRDDSPSSDADGTIRGEFDWDAVAPSTAVVETVAVAANAEPTALDRLYGSVDPDALDRLFRSSGTRSADGDPTVSFAFAGHDVTVRSGGVVVARPVGDDRCHRSGGR